MTLAAGLGSLTEAVSHRHWSDAETRRQTRIRISTLQARGFAPGDRVMLHFGNRLEFFAELLAIWQLGGCAIPVDARLRPVEVQNLASACRARFHIVDDATNPESVSLVTQHGLLNTLDCPPEGNPPTLPLAYPRLDDDALILFTSGSTGTPKGVVHTHRSLMARWASLNQSLGTKAYRRTLCLLPTHFGHGLICNCLFPLLAGCDLIIAPAFKPEIVMSLGSIIDDHQISFISSVPSMWNLALKTASPPRQQFLERIHIGSAPLSENLWRQVQEWSGTNAVLNAYGITETGSWVAGTTVDASDGKIRPQSGLVGEPWGAVIRILPNLDKDRGMVHEMGSGESGMIWLQTPAVMKGYFEQPGLTDEVLQHGWFKTGDIGFIDERGRLFLKGRERDEINKGGMKVYPADVDEVAEQFQATLDVCTFGYEDRFYGENVGIALVLDEPDDQTIVELYHWFSDRLARHKHPERWYLVDEIPRTSRGKINRETVMRSCMDATPINLRALLQR